MDMMINPIKKLHSWIKVLKWSKNVINFLKSRNDINKNLKVGFNFIILPENYKNLRESIVTY